MCEHKRGKERHRSLGTVVDVTKKLISAAVGPGETVVDATAGNGHDTLFLAGLVGDLGRVIAFDIQEQALENTYKRLEKAGMLKRCTLVNEGHEQIAAVVQKVHEVKALETVQVEATAQGQSQGDAQVAAIMFNLGYLPSGDHELVTQAETTRKAVLDGLGLLRIGGLMSIVVYSGHEGGAEEADMVEQLTSSLDQKTFAVLKLDFINRNNNSPFLFLIEREQ